ncbi:MAG: ATP-dependent DNA helicase RecG [Gemmatimonadales bacterium]|nr:MAG: ATP-dependent DNA helicase RecG [Gemmatimonadales bacterium]
MGSHAKLPESVQYLKGVGPRRAERLAKLGIHTTLDLLYHVPRRYEDATTVHPAARLSPGDDATVIGRVVSKGVLPTGRKLRIFRAVLRDASGVIECAWPGQPWLDRQIRRGDLLLVTGSVRFFHGPQLQPREFTVLESGGEAEALPAAGLVFPIYPATEGLGHKQIRTIVDANLDALLPELAEAELFADDWRSELSLPSLDQAIRDLHRPDSLSVIEPARRRLAYEELFFLQLLHARARQALSREPGTAMIAESRHAKAFLDQLPFELTNAQRRVLQEVFADMARPERMYRLLHGDVGSGKTVIAAAAMLKAIDNGMQALLMAPTELLAEQHVATLANWFEPLGVTLALLTGTLSSSQRVKVLGGLADGSIQAVVGTQALIQDGVGLHSPGLTVIDEQHRFGVDQRRALVEAWGTPDVLVMSATPIPRSLALALYGDLDVSTLDEMPPGRSPVITGVRAYESRPAALEWLRERLAEGRQAYIVYPLIEESEAVDAGAATVGRDELAVRFPDRTVELIHGQLSPSDKDAVMRKFLAGQIDVLVATTVIEVGIDVPNATVMFIEHAERFGLAQLHQLRGRVGRGVDQSWCVAFYAGAEAPERLASFAATTDGFRIAIEDLRLRGQGDFFGAEQHGVPGLRFADLSTDGELLENARSAARRLVAEDPELARGSNRRFARVIAERYADRERRFGIG